MIAGPFSWSWAITTATVVVALFLTGCRAIIPFEGGGARELAKAQFAMAEALRQNRDFDKALQVYNGLLEQHPGGEKAALVLLRIAEIYLAIGRYDTGMDYLENILKDYPEYKQLADVEYVIAKGLFLQGDYQGSMENLLRWFKRYSRHRLKPDAMVLFGENLRAVGDNFGAFKWWIKAKKIWRGNARRQAKLNRQLADLIDSSGLEDLERMVDYASTDDDSARISYRRAVLFLRHNEPERAKEIAMSLVRSTQEQSWISAGRELLMRIEEEMSVKSGVVGCLLPLSGPFAIYGEEILNGIQLGMGAFEGQGGSYDLELVIRDTEDKPGQALAGLLDLVNNEKVMAIIGPLSSKTALPVARKAQELGIPLVTLTQKQGVTEEGNMVFRNFLTPSQEVRKLVDMATDEMCIRRFGILYPDNSYGRYLMNLFWDRIEERGGVVNAVEPYSPQDTDFSGPIKKMIGLYYTRPDFLTDKLIEMRTTDEEESVIFQEEPAPIIDFEAVFLPDNFQRVALIAPQLVYHNLSDVFLMGTSLWQSPLLLETAKDYVQGAVFTSGFFEGAGEPGVIAFLEEYRADFGSNPGVLAASGYDTIRLLREILTSEEARTRRDVQRALSEHQGFAGITGDIVFDSMGELEKDPLLVTISGRNMTLLH